MKPKTFIDSLCSLDLENTFIPYSDSCEANIQEHAACWGVSMECTGSRVAPQLRR